MCLRVHPTFALLHPTESFVSFISIDGSRHEIRPDSGEQSYEGDDRPNGNICSQFVFIRIFILHNDLEGYIHFNLPVQI